MTVVADEQQALPFMKGPKEALMLLDNDPMIWDRIMKRMKVPLGENVKMLGMGGHGIAMQVGDHVLKLTDDPVEASAALILQKKPMPEAYSVFDVFKIPLKNGERYGIVTELLQPPDRTYQWVAERWERFSKGYEELNAKGVDEVFEGVDPMFAEAVQWLRRAAVNLMKRGIKYRDLTNRNIMKRPNGEHVMIDFGHMSDVPNQTTRMIPTAEVLEAIAELLDAERYIQPGIYVVNAKFKVMSA